MKKLSYLLLSLALPCLILTGCKYDDDDLWNKVNDHEERLAALEQWQATVNGNITSLQGLVTALQDNDYVTEITSFDIPVPGGYKITFAKSGEITIWNGAKGDKGDSGSDGTPGESVLAPVIGVAEYPVDSGTYYWTLDGEFIEIDSEKLPVTGEKGDPGTSGTNGITPKLQINATTNYWEVSYDNGATWTSLGIKATGDIGAIGPAGPQGPQGVQSDAIFAAGGISQTDETVTFILANNGGTITLPKYVTSLVAFESYELFYGSLTNNEITIVLPSTLKETNYTMLAATITGSNGTVTDIQTRTSAGDVWQVAVTKPTFTGGVLVAGSAKVILSTSPNIKLSETAMLTVTLTDAGGKKHSVSRPVKYFDGVIVDNTAGGLSTVATDASVTKLALKGSIDATDFTYIRSTLTALEVLDLSMTDLTSVPNRALRFDSGTPNTTLKKVLLPSTATTLEEAAFASCRALTYVNMEYVETIEKWAFEKCSAMTEIRPGDRLNTIANSAFMDCVSLREIEIPGSVQRIGGWVFSNCLKLETVILNEGVQNLSPSTFYSCGIVSISIPSTVTQIPEETFVNCESLERIILHDGITSIGEMAFANCRSLKSIKVPLGVTEISGYTFQSCADLKYVTFHDNITTIGEAAFIGCCNLGQSLILPAGLTTMGESAFSSCSNVQFVQFPALLLAIPKGAFMECANISFISLSDGLIEIGESAFWNTGLRDIMIPRTVTTIGDMAFMGCKQLMSVTSLARTVPTIGTSTFDNNYKAGRNLYYPSMADYFSWANYFETSTPQ